MGTVQVRRWTRQEYSQMVGAGTFPPGERAELIDGEIVAVTPQGSEHATAIRLVEGSLYARAGVAEYWLVNLVDRRLEVHREPAPQPEAPYGWGYRDVRPLSAGDRISPRAASHATVDVADLLP